MPIVDKAPDAFRTISEVADDLDLPQHVLRFWETRFQQIKPLKRGGGRRYYRPDDVELLKGIRYYLYGEGYTIKGVQRILKERGVKHVAELGRAQTETFAPPTASLTRVAEREGDTAADWPEAVPPSKLKQSFLRPLPFGPAPEDDDEDRLARPRKSTELRPEPAPSPTLLPFTSVDPLENRREPPSEARPEPQAMMEPVRPVISQPVSPLRQPPAMPVATPLTLPRMPAEDLRVLKAALFELAECKRILELAR
jgi:DNA-binding transcriptional MerR regulator